METSSARMVLPSPEPAPVGLNNRLADTKSHPRPLFLGGKERIEDLAGLVSRKSYAGIFHRYQKLFVAITLCAERELTRAIDGLHRLDPVDHQIHDDLLQLNAVRGNNRQPGRELRLHRN